MTWVTTCAVTSNLKAVGVCSCHQSQGAGAYCVGSATGRTTCYIRHNQSPHQICESCDFSFFSWLHFDDHRYLLVSLDLRDGDQKPHAVYRHITVKFLFSSWSHINATWCRCPIVLAIFCDVLQIMSWFLLQLLWTVIYDNWYSLYRNAFRRVWNWNVKCSLIWIELWLTRLS